MTTDQKIDEIYKAVCGKCEPPLSPILWNSSFKDFVEFIELLRDIGILKIGDKEIPNLFRVNGRIFTTKYYQDYRSKLNSPKEIDLKPTNNILNKISENFLKTNK